MVFGRSPTEAEKELASEQEQVVNRKRVQRLMRERCARVCRGLKKNIPKKLNTHLEQLKQI